MCVHFLQYTDQANTAERASQLWRSAAAVLTLDASAPASAVVHCLLFCLPPYTNDSGGDPRIMDMAGLLRGNGVQPARPHKGAGLVLPAGGVCGGRGSGRQGCVLLSTNGVGDGGTPVHRGRVQQPEGGGPGQAGVAPSTAFGSLGGGYHNMVSLAAELRGERVLARFSQQTGVRTGWAAIARTREHLLARATFARLQQTSEKCWRQMQG